MEFGQILTIWTARAAAALYVFGLLLILRRRWKLARSISTAGLLTFLIHVWCAFEYFYSWSHEIAYRDTARQTEELFGVDWGGGLYLNYLFTGVWFADCTVAWLSFGTWRARPAWISVTVNAFLSFMVINATVVVWVLRALRRGAN